MNSDGAQRVFVQALERGTEAADRDVAGYWLRDADAAAPDPHFAVRLVRAALRGNAAEACAIALTWRDEAAIAYAQDQEARR